MWSRVCGTCSSVIAFPSSLSSPVYAREYPSSDRNLSRPRRLAISRGSFQSGGSNPKHDNTTHLLTLVSPTWQDIDVVEGYPFQPLKMKFITKVRKADFFPMGAHSECQSCVSFDLAGIPPKHFQCFRCHLSRHSYDQGMVTCPYSPIHSGLAPFTALLAGTK